MSGQEILRRFRMECDAQSRCHARASGVKGGVKGGVNRISRHTTTDKVREDARRARVRSRSRRRGAPAAQFWVWGSACDGIAD